MLKYGRGNGRRKTDVFLGLKHQPPLRYVIRYKIAVDFYFVFYFEKPQYKVVFLLGRKPAKFFDRLTETRGASSVGDPVANPRAPPLCPGRPRFFAGAGSASQARSSLDCYGLRPPQSPRAKNRVSAAQRRRRARAAGPSRARPARVCQPVEAASTPSGSELYRAFGSSPGLRPGNGCLRQPLPRRGLNSSGLRHGPGLRPGIWQGFALPAPFPGLRTGMAGYACHSPTLWG